MMRLFWEQTERGDRGLPELAAIPRRLHHVPARVGDAFQDAIFQKSRAEMLKAGANFLKDGCSRRFVGCWPKYVKARVVDTKSNVIQANNRHGQTSASTEGSASESATSVTGLDQAVEESIGGAILLQSRLTVQRTFQGRTCSRASSRR
jgi:hypothetical protein